MILAVIHTIRQPKGRLGAPWSLHRDAHAGHVQRGPAGSTGGRHAEAGEACRVDQTRWQRIASPLRHPRMRPYWRVNVSGNPSASVLPKKKKMSPRSRSGPSHSPRKCAMRVIAEGSHPPLQRSITTSPGRNGAARAWMLGVASSPKRPLSPLSSAVPVVWPVAAFSVSLIVTEPVNPAPSFVPATDPRHVPVRDPSPSGSVEEEHAATLARSAQKTTACRARVLSIAAPVTQATDIHKPVEYGYHARAVNQLPLTLQCHRERPRSLTAGQDDGEPLKAV